MTQNTVAAQAGRKPQKKSQFSGMSRALVRRETISAYLFLLPSLIFFVTFVVVPMFICLFYSFTEYGLGGVKGFAGLENYIKLFQDPVFHRGFLNTLLIVVVAVPCVTAFSLWVSSAIYKMHSISRSFFRCVFYLPVVTGSVAITVVWKWILNPYNGILNQVAGTTGFDWLGNPKTAIWFIILILFTTWRLWATWISPSLKPPRWTAPPSSRFSGRSSGLRSCPLPSTCWLSRLSTPSSALR